MGHAIRCAGGSLAVVLLLVLGLAACAAGPAGPAADTPATAGGTGASGPTQAEAAAFNARAQQVIAQWDRSPLKATWRDGLILLDPFELITLPANDGFTSQHQKDAFYSGHFVLGGALPSAPLSGGVTWPGGGATVPLLTARAAFRRLATNQPCTNGPCGHFTVTGAKPGTMALATNRGSVTVPAWIFTVNGPPYTVTEAALAPGSYAVLPQSTPQSPPQRGFYGAGLDAVSPDGRVLTVEYTSGPCYSGAGALVYASATAVVIGSWGHSDMSLSHPCPDVLVGKTTAIRLAAPLGTRAVLDVWTGDPLAPSGHPKVGG